MYVLILLDDTTISRAIFLLINDIFALFHAVLFFYFIYNPRSIFLHIDN